MKTNLLFFRKGSETERTWYFDLSGVELTKRRVMTLEDFGDFFPLLAKWRAGRDAEGESGWVVDFGARKKAAREKAEPHRKLAEGHRAKVQVLGREIESARSGRDRERVEILRGRRKAEEGKAKEEDARVRKIMNAVYDLRAVNPNRKVEVDSRTPEQLRGVISARHREIAKLLGDFGRTEK